jgi:hypothetical protein
MPIGLEEDTPRTSTPVVKRQRIGDKFVGAIVRIEQRDVQKRDEATQVLKPQLKANGRPRQELVVHCLAMEGTTSIAGIGDDNGVPAAGTEVRLILRGGAFGDWIEQRKTHRGGALNVGDVVVQKVEFAQAYGADGTAKGGKIMTQAEADLLPRSTSVGFYGPLTLHEPKDQTMVGAAEAAYRKATAVVLDAPATPGFDEEPF